MGGIYILIIVAIIIAVVYFSTKNKSNDSIPASNPYREKTIEERDNYVESLSPTAKVIVNDGMNFFFIDHEQEFFGADTSGKTYSFNELHSMSVYKDAVTFLCMGPNRITVGKDILNQNSTFPLDTASIELLKKEMMPVLRKNLYELLEQYNITPTHEYERNGEIWGCDINSRMFFVVYGSPQVYRFSDLLKVTIEDVRSNSMCDANYIMHIFIKQEDDWDDLEIEEYFDYKDQTFNDLLAMFKGIKNRQ